MLTKPDSYDDLVARHDLTVASKPGDWRFVDGDLALTKDGDLAIGDPAYNAMYRLIEAWRLNAPTMRLMFDTVSDLRAKETSLEASIDTALTQAFEPWRSGGKIGASAYHDADDASSAAVIGRRVLAGSLMIIVAALLSRFRSDAEPSAVEWSSTPPMSGSISIGQVVIAAANSFRHHDEWVKALVANTRDGKKIDSRQTNSMQILVSAFGMDGVSDLFEDLTTCEQAALVFGQNGFDEFAGSVLGYANAIAARIEARSQSCGSLS